MKAHERYRKESLESLLVMETTKPDSNIENNVDGREQVQRDTDNDTSSDINEENFGGIREDNQSFGFGKFSIQVFCNTFFLFTLLESF